MRYDFGCIRTSTRNVQRRREAHGFRVPLALFIRNHTLPPHLLPAHTLMYHYEEMFVVNGLSPNFLALQSLSREDLLQLKVRPVVDFLFGLLRTTVDERDAGKRYPHGLTVYRVSVV